MASSTTSPRRDSPYLLSSPSPSTQQNFSSKFYTSKILHIADITYPESYLRTPLPLLPFPQPKWLCKPTDGNTSPNLGAYEIDESVDDIIESIEGGEDGCKGSGNMWGDEKREWMGWEERERWKREWTGIAERSRLKRRCKVGDGDVRGRKKCRA